MSTVRAIYENGVFRPIQPVDLPEHTEVEFELKAAVSLERRKAAREEIYRILSRSYEGGDPYDSERHNEHQP